MLQVSRDSNLKIPKKIEIVVKNVNSVEDQVSVKKAILKANNKRINTTKIKSKAEEVDNDLKVISKIPASANDMIVVTVVKKLGAYVITVTEKSPAKYRGVFVNRMQNYCLDTLELLLQANFVRIDGLESKQKREEYQKEAIIKLKMLGYISMVAESFNCILMRQYKQISSQIAEAINLITAWKKSDDERWRKRK